MWQWSSGHYRGRQNIRRAVVCEKIRGLSHEWKGTASLSPGLFPMSLSPSNYLASQTFLFLQMGWSLNPYQGPPLGLSQLFSHSTLLPSFYPYAYATLNPLYFPKFNTCNFKATCMEWPGLSNEHLYFLRPSAQCLLPWRFSCSLLLIQKLFFPPASPWLAPAQPRIPSRWLKHLSWSASFLPWLRDLPDIRDRIWLIPVLTAISGLWVNKWINEWTKGKRLQA